MSSSLDVRQYDDALLGILQSEGKIQPFLDVMFGFLFRRTDFYKNLENENGKIGFAQGVAEKLTYNAFKKYQKAEEDRRKVVVVNADKLPVTNCEDVVESVISTKRKEDNLSEKTKEKTRDLCDSYNGAVRDTYTWSQSNNDVDVRIKIPKDVVKAKCVKVGLTHDRLSASYCRNAASSSNTWETLLDGHLTFRINLEKSVWTLVPGEYIHVCLEKSNADRWWEALLVDEPKIDVSQLDTHCNLHDLPDDEQAKVEELIYEQEQKTLGKPTIQQTKIHEMLKAAWDQEGSPFKGQPFDPSVVDVCGSTDEVLKYLPTKKS